MIYDTYCRMLVDQSPDLGVSWVLMAAYLYYCRDTTILSDACYDYLVNKLRASRTELVHPHTYILPADFWDAGNSSLFILRPIDYPARVRSAACSLAKLRYE